MIKLPPAKTKGSIQQAYEIHVHTEEMASDLNNAGYCWAEIRLRFKFIKAMQDFREDQLQLLAFQSIVSFLPDGVDAKIYTSSDWMYGHFYGRYHFRDPNIRQLPNGIRKEILERALEVQVLWIPYRENLAGGLLRLPYRKTPRFK